jgi:hypothetical protein
MTEHSIFFDESEQRWADILGYHADEATALAHRLVREGKLYSFPSSSLLLLPNHQNGNLTPPAQGRHLSHR